MNKVILMGRLTREPEVRHSQSANGDMAIASWSLAVDRRQKTAEQSADFINCKSFGKQAEFVEKYFRKGMKMVLVGRIQTGSYTNKDGQKVYTTDVVADEIEFAESKNASADTPRENLADELPVMSRPQATPVQSNMNDFLNIPEDSDLPFARM